MSKKAGPFIPGVTTSGVLPGADMLSERNASSKYNLHFIHIDKIVPNEINERYEQIDLQSLSSSIEDQGLLHNLVTTEENEEGFVTLISGERRWRAINILREQNPDRFFELFPGALLPCKISEPLDVLDEEIRLIVANSEVRSLDVKQRLNDVRRLAELYREREKKTGIRVSEQISKALGMSERQIYKYLSLEKLIPELNEAFENDVISITIASEIAGFGETEQLLLAEILKEEGKLTEDDITSAKQLKEEKDKVEKQVEDNEAKLETLKNIQNSAKSEKEKEMTSSQIEKVKKQQDELVSSMSRSQLKQIRLINKTNKTIDRLYQDLEKLETALPKVKDVVEISTRLEMLKLRIEEVGSSL